MSLPWHDQEFSELRDWFAEWKRDNPLSFWVAVLFAVALSEAETGDYSACVVLLNRGEVFYILEVVRGRFPFDALKRKSPARGFAPTRQPARARDASRWSIRCCSSAVRAYNKSSARIDSRSRRYRQNNCSNHSGQQSCGRLPRWRSICRSGTRRQSIFGD